MFSEYHVLQDEENQEDWQAGGEFCVNLTSVLDALQLLGPLDNRTGVWLSYNLSTEIFKVELLQDGEQGVLCTSAIQAILAPEDDPEGNSLSNVFGSSPVAARMMIRSGILRELLPEWSSVAGASCASVAVSAKRGLEIAILGNFGECWVLVPATGDHLVSPIECQKTVTRTYPLHSLLSSMKGLEIAEETCININSEGIMAIQHKTIDPTGQGSSSYVDFIMTCLEDEEEDDEEDEETTTVAQDQQSSQISGSQTTLRSRSSQTQQRTPVSAATPTHSRRRRRRRQRASPSQASSKAFSNANAGGDDVEQDSSDTEGEGGTPSERQKRQAIQNRKQQEPDSSSDEEETQPMITGAPLFGSVARDKSMSTDETPPRRRQRRSTSRPPRQPQGGKGRKRTKRDRNDSEEDEQSDDEEVEYASRTTAGVHNRDGDCSSPEIVYGKQT